MSVVQSGLLQRLQQTGEQSDWGRLIDLFSSHLFLWACRSGLQGPEAAELVREVFARVMRELPGQSGRAFAGQPERNPPWSRPLESSEGDAAGRELGGWSENDAGESPAGPEPAEQTWTFRGWLRRLASEQRRELIRKRKVTTGAPAVPADAETVPVAADALWEGEYLPFLLGAAVDLLQGAFPPADWKVCREMTIEGRSAAEARVLQRLRQELNGLLD
jgi:DNA-directed RNA polymerase specialized sigma24 family protein